MEMEKIAKMESGQRNSKDGKPVSPPPYDIPTERRYSVDETTEVKPLTKRKRKVSREIDPATQRLSGTGSLNGSLTHPWSGRLEPMEYSEPFPGPYKTALFWVRRGQGLDPIPPAFSVPASPGTVGVGSGTATEERYLAAVQGSALPQKTRQDGVPIESPINAPWKQGKKNTEVFMRVTFRKVGQVDTVTETFNADIIIQARWLYDENRDDVRDGQKQWDPMLYVENTNNNVIKPLHREMWTDPTGDVFVIQRLTARGVFTETMELDHFPFDCQNLTITVASERHSGEITLIPDPLDHSILHQGNFVDKQEWHLYEHVEVHEPEGDESDFRSSLPPRPALSFTCQAARRIGYFTWNVFLLLVVIFLMHMCSFSVAKTAYNARLSMSFTMFLTAIAFKIALNSYLPRISYLTYMDSYLLLQLVMMAFVCGWHATVSHLPTAEDVADRVERIMIIIIGILYAAFQIIFFTIAYCIPGKRRRELRDKHRDYRRGSVKMKAGSSFA